MSAASASDKGKGKYIPTPKKKFAPQMKPKGIVVDASVAPVAPILKEEEGPMLGGNDIILSLTNVPVGGLSQEEQLVTALEEQPARVASFIYDRASGNVPISLSHFIFFFLY